MSRATGVCAYCGSEKAKGGMTRHLAGCSARAQAIAKANTEAAQSERLYHLRLKAKGDSEFWLDLEASETARLHDVDWYLRAIWLECCGHMSRFSTRGWGSAELPKRATLSRVFEYSDQIVHIYDFGTESVTLIQRVAVRIGVPTTAHPIALMARNVLPTGQCTQCGERATSFCVVCVEEDGGPGGLCAIHVESHPHDEEAIGPLPVVNSPRSGLCGYRGPAKPPY